MAFRMKVADLFRIGEKTVFTGDLKTDETIIRDAVCMVEVDGRKMEIVCINGEVHSGSPDRDLWTKSPISLTREAVESQEVWLVST